MAVVAAKFLETQLHFTEADSSFSDMHVPGIGAAGQRRLRDANPGSGIGGGITNAAQVVGWFMRLGGDAERTRTLLVDKCGCHAPFVTKPVGGELRECMNAVCSSYTAAHIYTDLLSKKKRRRVLNTEKVNNF